MEQPEFVKIPFKNYLKCPNHQNEVIITQVFKLTPGTTDKYDETQHIMLKEFTSQCVNEDRRAYFEQEMKKIYHLMPLKNYDNAKTYFINTAEFNEPDKKWIEIPFDQQVFIKYRKDKSVGCGHYIRGCQKKCETCQKFYPCRLCHDDEEDHVFPRYDTKTVKCNYCNTEQPFAQYCIKCNVCFGSYCCDKCKLVCDMGAESKPNYHCDGCKHCMVGIRSYSKHCDKCEACFNVKYFAEHQCKKKGVDCVICMGDLTRTIYGVSTPPCGHSMHQYCYQQLLNEHNHKCPVCKKNILMGEHRAEVQQRQKELFKRLIVPVEFIGLYDVLKCNECGEQTTQQHFFFNHCPHCDQFNSDVIQHIPEIIAKIQIKVLRQKFGEKLIEPMQPTIENVKAVIQNHLEKQKTWDQIEEFLSVKLTEETLVFYIRGINRCQSIEQLKEIILLGGQHDEEEQEHEE